MKKLAIALIFLVGCANNNSVNTALVLEPLQPLSYQERTTMKEEEYKQLNQIIIDFSQSLFEEVLARGEENPVISPLSLYYALAMVSLGARNYTQQEFIDLLGLHPQDLAPKLNLLQRFIAETAGETDIRLANSVWFDEWIYLNESFANRVEGYFHVTPFSRSFLDLDTIEEINAWVYANTNGLIEEVIEEIDPGTIMFLINVIYFFGRWEHIMETSTRNFYLSDGTNVDTTFFHTSFSGASLRYTVNFLLSSGFSTL